MPDINIFFLFFHLFSKIVELEEELRVVGNNLKSLEVSEEKVLLSFFHLPKKKFKKFKFLFQFYQIYYILK